jgi:hypothetical protein
LKGCVGSGRGVQDTFGGSWRVLFQGTGTAPMVLSVPRPQEAKEDLAEAHQRAVTQHNACFPCVGGATHGAQPLPPPALAADPDPKRLSSCLVRSTAADHRHLK